MTDNEYTKTRKAAVDALVHWAKTDWGQFTMRDAVNDYLEASGTNRPSIGGYEAIFVRRKIAANRLAIDCMYALSKEKPPKVDRELEEIAVDVSRQEYGITPNRSLEIFSCKKLYYSRRCTIVITFAH